MERRATGIAVLALVALAVLFLPVVGGKRIDGSATPADVPTVGGCLVGVQAISWTAYPTVAGGQPAVPPTTGTPGSCTASDAARVLAVRFGVDLPRVMDLSDMFAREDADCSPAVAAYQDHRRSDEPLWSENGRQIGFRTSASMSAQIVGPTEVSGSGHWLACVAVGAYGIPTAADLSSDRLPSAFARCKSGGNTANGPDDDSSAPCEWPHGVEVIAQAFLALGSPTDADYQAACRATVAAITGMPDPTAGGLLRVLAVDDGSWPGGPGSCRVIVTDPERTLSGTLIGIGSAPLPWTS